MLTRTSLECPIAPEGYEAVIMKCLEKQQDNPYQTMNELLDVMEPLGITRDLPIADAAEISAVAGTKTNSLPAEPRAYPPPRVVKSRDNESNKKARQAANPDSKNPDKTILVEF